MLTKYFIFISFIFLLCGCKKDSTTSPVETNGQIIPLKVGNTWNYREIDFINFPPDTTYFASTVVSDTMIANEHWYYYQFSDPNDGILSINRSDGFYYFAFGGGKIVYKYPSAVNEIYMDFLSDTVKIESVNYNLSVPSGTFSCYHYLITDFVSNKINSFLSPNVGLIKRETFSSMGDITSRVELISYHLN